MKCPECNGNSLVIDSRERTSATGLVTIWRRRRCTHTKSHKFSTVETYAAKVGRGVALIAQDVIAAADALASQARELATEVARSSK